MHDIFMGIVKIILFIFMDYKHAIITPGTHEQTASSSKCLCLLEEGKHIFNQYFLAGVYFHCYFVELLEYHNIQERISHYHSLSLYRGPHTCHTSLLLCCLIPSPLSPFVLRPRLTLTQAVVQAGLELVILLPQPPE